MAAAEEKESKYLMVQTVAGYVGVRRRLLLAVIVRTLEGGDRDSSDDLVRP